MYQLGYDRNVQGLEQAKQALDSALHLSPDLPEGHLALGLFNYWGRRDYDGALREFDIVRRVLPSNADVFHNTANVQRRRGALRDAVENYRLAAELNPREYNPMFSGAEALLYLREFGRSEQLVDKVIELAPDFIDGYILKATLQIHRGDTASARRILADLTTKIPGSKWRPISHHWRAGLFRILDDSLASAERRAVVGTFGLDRAQYLLARAMAYQRFNDPRSRMFFDSAAAHLDSTVKRLTKNAAAFGLLGIADAGIGRYDDAVRAAEQAENLLPAASDALDGPEWVTNMALVYTMVGNTVKALETLERAMRIPSRLSPKWLELDPAWAPLRREARFQRLIHNPPPLDTIPAPAR
jgi:serine/threonine-protein kinase